MKKILGLTLFIFASSLFAQVQLGKNVQVGGGSGQGAGTVGAGTSGQFAQYPSNGNTVQGVSMTGDGSLSLGGAFTLSTVNGAPGTCGDSTHYPTFAVNMKGLTTSCTPMSFPSPALFPGTNGIVFNTSTTASRNATFSDIVPLWGSGSCTGYLKSDGTCGAGGGTSVGSAGTIQAADGGGGFLAATSINIQNGIGTGIYDAFGAAGMAGTTILVAASNSPNKAIANVICTGTNDAACINGAIATACPAATSTNVVGCNVRLEDGLYNLETSLVFNTDGWNLTGMGHGMWGGYVHQWTGELPITAWSITSNVATFTATNTLVAGNDVVLIGFGTSTFFNNFTGIVLSTGLSSSHFEIAFTHADGSATEAGDFISPTGSIGNGGAQLRAIGSGYPLIRARDTVSCGNGADQNRCRGWAIKNIYGVCYGYSGDFLDVDSQGSGPDNIMFDDNVIQRCNKGISGSFDSPSITANSFQDNLGDFFNGGGLYIYAHDNLLYDNGGHAYVGNFSRGGNISDRVWGDLLGGFLGGCTYCAIHNMPIFQLGIDGAVQVAGPGNTISGLSINSTQGPAILFNGNGVGGGGSVITNSGTIYGNSIYSTGFTTGADNISVLNASGFAITGNSIVGSSGAVNPGAAINASSCTNCTIGINQAAGTWNYGGPPIVGGTGDIVTGNLTNFVVNQGIASITSAYLLGRYQATNATPATNSTPITAWADSSGLANNVATLAGSPTYITASPINSLPAIQFNGTSSSGAITALTASSTKQPRTVWIVFNQTSAGTAGQTPTLWASGTSTNTIYFNGTSNDLCVYSGSSFCSTIAPTTAATHVLEVVINGASSRIVLDGTSVATYTAGSSSSGNQMWIGANRNLANNFFTGYLAEEAYYNGANTSGDAQTLGAAYCSNFGVTCGTSW